MIKIQFSKIALLSKHGQNLTIFVMAPTRVPQFNTNFSWVVAGRHEQIIYQIKVCKTIFLPNLKVQLATHTKNVVFIILFLTKKCLNLSKFQSKSWNQNSPFSSGDRRISDITRKLRISACHFFSFTHAYYPR